MSAVRLRTRDGYEREVYARLGLSWPADKIDDHGYLLAEKGWDPVKFRPTAAYVWVSNPRDGSVFATEEAAWLAFDASGCGRREDYVTEPAEAF